jgi:glutathione S-transferase
MGMTLRNVGASPFGRKVRLAAAVLGLADQITIEAADTMNPEDSLRGQNPLGKIPALILDDGRVLYDSRVIIEYLDTIAGGGKLIPSEIDARFQALTGAALADGILDAGILIVYEGRFRPDIEPYGPWIGYQLGKIERGLAALSAAPPPIEPVTVGAIGAACAIGYLDFRKQLDWRPGHPKLVSWLDAFAAAVPAFDETRPDRI